MVCGFVFCGFVFCVLCLRFAVWDEGLWFMVLGLGFIPEALPAPLVLSTLRCALRLVRLRRARFRVWGLGFGV